MSYRYRYPALSPNGLYVASGAGQVDVGGELRGMGWGPVWLDDDGIVVNRGKKEDYGGNAAAAGTWYVPRAGGLGHQLTPIGYQHLTASGGRWAGCTPGIRLRTPNGEIIAGRYHEPCLVGETLAVLFDRTVDEKKPLVELVVNGTRIAVGKITQPSLSRTHVTWRQGFGQGWRTRIANLDGSNPRDITVGVQEHWSVLVETPEGDLVLSHDGSRCYLRRPGETAGWLVATGDTHEPRAVWTPAGVVAAWMAYGKREVRPYACTLETAVDLRPVENPLTVAPFPKPTAVYVFFGRESRYGVDPTAPGHGQVVVDSGITTTGRVIIARVSDQGRDLIAEYRQPNDWARVDAIYVAEEKAPVTKAKYIDAIDAARRRVRELGLSPRPILTYTGPRAWNDLPTDWFGVQCYPEAGDTPDVAEHRWRNLLQAYMGKPVLIIGGAYDRQDTIPEPLLVECLRRAIELMRVCKGGAFFSWRREGGAAEYPRAAALLRAATAAARPPAQAPIETEDDVKKPGVDVIDFQAIDSDKTGRLIRFRDRNNPKFGTVEVFLKNGSLHVSIENEEGKDTTGSERKVI